MHVRPATASDCVRLVVMLQGMVEELSHLGHHRPSTDPSVWTAMEDGLRADVVREDACVLVLERTGESVAFARARVVVPHPVFESQRILHVSDLYVEPSHRRAGFGRRLLEACLDWGRQRGCVQAQLNVLRDSPALALYAALEFGTLEFHMSRAL